MPVANVFNIVNGEFALALVNTAAVGYLDAWQAPAGKTATTAVIADYTGAADWRCQVINGRIEASPNITQRTTEATFCGPALKTPIAASSSFTLSVDMFQDVHVSTGLNKFLYENDTLEAYFLLGLNGGVAPRAIGRARVVAGSFGGKAEEDLKDALKLECTRKPSIKFGNATTSIIVGTDFGNAYAPLPDGGGVGSGFDPAAHSVAEVKDYIEAHPDERHVVLAAEAAGRSRASLSAESMAAS